MLESSTPTSSPDSSKQKVSYEDLVTAGSVQSFAKRGNTDLKVRTMNLRTATSPYSASIIKSDKKMGRHIL